MILLKYLSKLIRILNDKTDPREIAGAVALGAMVGLLPGFKLLSLLIFLVIFLVNVNLSSALLAVVLFKPLGFILDPLAHHIGVLLLVKLTFLKPLWTFLYNIPLVPFTRFNNTVVLGSLVIGILLFIPLFLLTKKGIVKYREEWREKVNKLKIVQVLKASKLYNIYIKISSFRGN